MAKILVSLILVFFFHQGYTAAEPSNPDGRNKMAGPAANNLAERQPDPGEANEQRNPVISGVIRDATNGETLIGATVFIVESGRGAVSNAYGFYSLSLPAGSWNLRISYIGYESLEVNISLAGNITRNFDLHPSTLEMQEVVVSSRRRDRNISETQMSSVQLNAETIKRVPAFMGEVDLLKTVQMLPGVQTVAEGFSGFSVRGGSTDHNLILLDEAVVYNASHLLGFFSVFNSDAIKDMSVHKGDIPAQHGGRLASLLDIRMRDGNMKKLSFTGGIGSISSRLTVEGPFVRDRGSFMISGRRTYADMFLALSSDSLVKNNTLFFYDLNLKGNWIINENHRVFLSGYYGRDVFAFQDIMDMNWGNATQTLRWNYIINERLFSNTSFIYSDYQHRLGFAQGGSSYKWDSGITDYGVKTDFTFYPNPGNTVRFGGQVFRHSFSPGNITNGNNGQGITIPENSSVEYVVYASNDLDLHEKFSLQYGLRYVIHQNMGEARVYNFDENYQPAGYTDYRKGEIYNTKGGLEPRVSGAFRLTDASSVKGSYSRTRQYMQLASNSSAGMPTDVWFPASPNIKPQVSDQVAIGYFRNLNDNMFETSVEIYYKDMQNQIDFRDNANIYFNEMIEGEIRTGIAEAYGMELMIRKNEGKLTGWVSYTLSSARRKIDEINNGNWYRANYDKPHNFTLVLNQDMGRRLDIGLNWVFTSGAPLTLPTGRWEYGNLIMPSYSERNGYRLPRYHRLDLSATYQLGVSRSRRLSHELNFSVYNVYNRKNPFTIYFESEAGNKHNMNAKQMSLFGIVPSVTWNFRF
jgi:outer membrane receptor for ferrienterochelin and colicin